MMRAALLLLIVAVVNLASAQGDWQPCTRADLQVAMARYEDIMKETKAWRMRMDLVSFADAGQEAADKGAVTIVRAGDHVRADHMGLITYQDGRICAVADPEERIVVVSESKPVLDLATNQRVDLLANSASSLLRRTSSTGTAFKLLFQGNDAPFNSLQVEYSARGHLARLMLEWKPVMVTGETILQTHSTTPRVEMTVSSPTAPDRKETEEAVNGLEARLREVGNGYRAIGPWADYRVVDTRYRP